MNQPYTTAPPRTALRQRLRVLLLSVFVGMIPVGSGLLILYWQVDRSLTRGSAEAGQRIIDHLDKIIERADDVTARAGAFAGQRCGDLLEPLRRMVAAYPVVRSVVLGDPERFYCGSELGELDSSQREEMFGTERLVLRASSLPAPDRSSLLFRRFEGGHSVNAVIDGQVLGDILERESGSLKTLIENGGLFLDKQAKVADYSFSDHSEHHALQTSRLYGYRVHSGYPTGHSLQAFKAQAWPMLATLLLIGVVTAGVCHWASGQRLEKR
jgi:hypothetical protein